MLLAPFSCDFYPHVYVLNFQVNPNLIRSEQEVRAEMTLMNQNQYQVRRCGRLEKTAAVQSFSPSVHVGLIFPILPVLFE